MLRPTAVKAVALPGHRLLIDFDNGESRIFDATPLISGKFYGELADEGYFSTVKTDGFTVVWPHGQDFCPDDIYYLSVPVQNKETEYDVAVGEGAYSEYLQSGSKSRPISELWKELEINNGKV